MKNLLYLFGVLLSVSCSSQSKLSSDCESKIKDSWKHNSENTFFVASNLFIKDLNIIGNSCFKNRSKTEIINLMGIPNYFNDSILSYSLTPPCYSKLNSCQRLKIYITKDKVTNWEIEYEENQTSK
jgi:hypothetical protein